MKPEKLRPRVTTGNILLRMFNFFCSKDGFLIKQLGISFCLECLSTAARAIFHLSGGDS
jgi:hypothetical protein